MNWATGILAGGKSRRMGQDKARLPYRNSSLLASMLRRFPGRVFLSVAEEGAYADILQELPDVTLCPDRMPGCGPLGGLYSLLCVCPEEFLFVCAVDMPLVPAKLPEVLAEKIEEQEDAIWLADETGRVHPLCGLYRKRAWKAIETQLSKGCLRMTELQTHIRIRVISAKELDYSTQILLNCNDPEAYAFACRWECGEQRAEK